MTTWKYLPFLLVLVAAATSASAQTYTRFVYSGELSQPSDSPEDSWFKEVELADVDQDGWLDIVLPQKQPCADPCSGPNEPVSEANIDHLYLNEPGLILALDAPTDAFAFRPTVEVFPLFTTTRNYDVELADLDLDGVLDIIRPDRYGHLKVLWGNLEIGEIDFLQFVDIFSFGGNPNSDCVPDPMGNPDLQPVSQGNYDDVDVIDLDFDGDLDFAVAQYDTCGRSFLVENLALSNIGGTVVAGVPGTFAIRGVDPDELPASLAHSVSFGSVDDGGAPQPAFDLLLANSFSGSYAPQLYLGAGQPFGFEANPIELADPGLDGPTVVADLRDLDLDGKTDIYIAQGFFPTSQTPDAPSQTHGVYFHSGNDLAPYPSFTPWPGTVFHKRLYDARYADLDHDAQNTIEIVTVNINVTESGATSDTEINIASVQGQQLIDVSDDFLPSTLAGGIAIDLGDLDNDGDLDMVLGGISTGDDEIYSAAHVYENRTFTRFDRTYSEGEQDLVALDTLTAGDGATVTGSARVQLRAPRVLLTDGFIASPTGQGMNAGRFEAGPLTP